MRVYILASGYSYAQLSKRTARLNALWGKCASIEEYESMEPALDRAIRAWWECIDRVEERAD